MKRVLYALVVVIVWLLAWGSITVANVVGGIAVAIVVMLIVPERRLRTGSVTLRPIPLARLAWFFISTTASANVALIRIVFSRRPFPPAGVLDIAIPPLNDVELTMVTSLMALSPGSITVDIQSDPWVLSVHFLDISDPEAQRVWTDQLVEHCQRVTGARP